MTSIETRASVLPAIAKVAEIETPSPLGLVRLLDSRSVGASAGGEKGLPVGGPGAPSLGLRSVSAVSSGRCSVSSSESLRLNGLTDAIFPL